MDDIVLKEKRLEAMRATKEFMELLIKMDIRYWADRFMLVYSLLEQRNLIEAISLNKKYGHAGMGSLSDRYVDNQSEFDQCLNRQSKSLINIRIYTDFGVNRASLYNPT